MHQKVTRKGTVKSTIKPWKMAKMVNRCPQVCVIMGNVVSIVVAPPAEMGASGPKIRASRGVPKRVIASRTRLATRAIVPSSIPRYSVRKMLDNE